MCDYEDKILARQELQEIYEDNGKAHPCVYHNFPNNLHEDNLYDAIHAEAMRSEVWNMIPPEQSSFQMTAEQFVACVNYSDSGYHGFESWAEILGYIMYLEKEVADSFNCKMQILEMCEKIKNTI